MKRREFIMKIMPAGMQSVRETTALLALVAVLTACARSTEPVMGQDFVTPTVDYVEALDVYSAPHKDSFLNQLAMNYRSYAIYNARTSGYPDIGELFANKAVAAFSGEVPFPESLDNWPVENEQEAFDLNNSYNELIEYLKSDVAQAVPDLAAELQAKFDCWLSASASGQFETAEQCRVRFLKALDVLKNCAKITIVNGETVISEKSTCFTKTKSATDSSVGEMEVQSVMETSQGSAPAERNISVETAQTYYPDTYSMNSVRTSSRPREGVIVVNNVNVPQHLINPEPVRPLVFNQNIFGGDKTVNKSATDNSVTDSNNTLNAADNSVRDSNNSLSVQGCQHDDLECQQQQQVQDSDSGVMAPSFMISVMEKDMPPVECPVCAQTPDCPECEKCQECQKCQECKGCPEPEKCPDCVLVAPDLECPVCQEVVVEEIPMLGEELVSRAEFIDMMMAMRAELQAINARLDKLQAAAGEKTMIKVQQIPLEPTQHIMEEVFEVRFDFNKATIKPEYQELIKKLATATQENKNIKVSVVGHTDTAGTSNYNYALGGRRAEAVQKMLVKYGIPASQIVAVSAGEEGLAVPTPDNTPNAENRRVRVVKEIHYTEEPKPVPMEIQVEEYSIEQ